jgi:hypothetical protein
MPLTIEKAAEAFLVFSHILSLDAKKEFLPFKTKLMIGTRVRKLKADAENFQKEQEALYKRLGEPTYHDQTEDEKKAGKEPRQKGWKIAPDSPNKAELDKLLKELRETEAEFDVLKPLPFDSLGDPDKPNPIPGPILNQLQDIGGLALPPDEE